MTGKYDAMSLPRRVSETHLQMPVAVGTTAKERNVQIGGHKA